MSAVENDNNGSKWFRSKHWVKIYVHYTRILRDVEFVVNKSKVI